MNVPDNVHLTLKFLGEVSEAIVLANTGQSCISLQGARSLHLQCTGQEDSRICADPIFYGWV